jgi:hypothetical protein
LGLSSTYEGKHVTFDLWACLSIMISSSNIHLLAYNVISLCFMTE